MSADNDQFYITKILNGDDTAFAVLVNRYKNMVFTLAMQMLKNREEAEEISQDTFIKIFKSLDKFKGDSKFSTWVYRIAYNSCLDRIKTYKRQYATVGIDEFTENQVKTLETAFDLMERSDREKSVKECLHRLPEDDCVLITLFYYEELSLEEISKVIGIDPNNVKVKLFRARKRLATILKERMEPTILENYGQ
ncbi:MAG: RNA polymerase sigma factor [Aurantibacter sp.]